MDKEIKVIAQNKKANHDYFIEETFEAGLVLTGTEIKSIRRGRINLKDSYCQTIASLTNVQNEIGMSIVPLKLYIKNGYAKLLIGVAKGKKNYDKRHVLKQKEANKEINRVLKDKQRY